MSHISDSTDCTIGESGSELYTNLWSDMYDLSDKYMDRAISPTSMEEQIREIWDRFIYAIVNKDHYDPPIEPEDLVILIVQMRELGTVSRAKREGNASSTEREEAVLSHNQRLWSDLPYLVEQIQTYWTDNLSSLGRLRLSWLSYWTAFLCSVGVYPAELCRCALLLFSEALEKDIPANRGEDPDVLALEELLPSCRHWMDHGSYRLAVLSATPPLLTEDAHISHAPGPLADHITSSGFSIERWVFWRERFKVLATSENPDVASDAYGCLSWSRRASRRAGVDIPEETEHIPRKRKHSEESSSYLDEDVRPVQKKIQSLSLDRDTEDIGCNTASDAEVDVKGEE